MSAADETDANKALVRDAYAAIGRGDLKQFLARLADDVTWTFVGTHRFGRTFRGKHDIVDNLCRVLAAHLDGVIALDIVNLIAEGDQVVAEMQGRAVTPGGQRYDNRYCVVLTVRDGLIRDLREYLDTELVTAVFGRG